MTDDMHVRPLGDFIEHEWADCICMPRVEPVKRDDGSMGWIHIHHSLDGREANEADVDVCVHCHHAVEVHDDPAGCGRCGCTHVVFEPEPTGDGQ